MKTIPFNYSTHQKEIIYLIFSLYNLVLYNEDNGKLCTYCSIGYVYTQLNAYYIAIYPFNEPINTYIRSLYHNFPLSTMVQGSAWCGQGEVHWGTCPTMPNQVFQSDIITSIDTHTYIHLVFQTFPV